MSVRFIISVISDGNTIVGVSATFEKVKEQMLCASIDVEITCIDTCVAASIRLRFCGDETCTYFTVESQNPVFLTLTW